MRHGDKRVPRVNASTQHVGRLSVMTKDVRVQFRCRSLIIGRREWDVIRAVVWVAMIGARRIDNKVLRYGGDAWWSRGDSTRGVFQEHA